MNIFDSIINFFNKYYIQPVIFYSGYNIVNTITYAALFIILSYIFYKKFILTGKINLDKYFLLFTFFSNLFLLIIRVSVDFGWIERILIFYTPMIEFLFILLMVPYIYIKKYRKHYVYLLIILSLILPFLLFKSIPNYFILLTLLMFSLIIYFSIKENFLLFSILGEGLDTLSSSIGVLILGYGEEHVLANFLMSFGFFGTLSFYLVKFSVALVLSILVYRDKEMKEELKRTILYLIGLLGLIPGIRNSLLISF